MGERGSQSASTATRVEMSAICYRKIAPDPRNQENYEDEKKIQPFLVLETKTGGRREGQITTLIRHQ